MPATASPSVASCSLRLQSAAAAPVSWRAAASAVQSRLRSEWDARDCARIDIVLDSGEGGAAVDFVNLAGAHAGRRIGGPEELAPTVQALITTLDPSSLSPNRPPLEPPKAGGDPAARPVPSSPSADSPPVPANPSAESLGVIFGAGLGARVGIASEKVASLVLHGYAAFDIRRWELGLAASWEPSYRRTLVSEEDDTVSWKDSAIAAGIIVGRREPLGAWDLTYGATLSGAVVRGQSNDDDGTQSAERLDARLGAYLGTAVPRSAPIRFRALLTADFVPARAAQSTLGIADLPAWMGMGFVGVEMGAR